ncbi:MAG: GxxExxY protein [Acidobacteria bacterium]|nr:GxxExxY protein [Acidobacteriota bacterium]
MNHEGAKVTKETQSQALKGRAEAASREVVDAALKIHRRLGPGLLESAYEACLIYECKKRGLSVASQVVVPVEYDGIKLDQAFRLDLLVEGSLVVELKAVEAILPIHEAQILSYMKLTGCHLGLILNFHVPLIKNGIRRFVL